MIMIMIMIIMIIITIIIIRNYPIQEFDWLKSRWKRCKLKMKTFDYFLINRAQSGCMEESWLRPRVQTSLRLVYTRDLGQDSPVQTSCSINNS